MTSILHLYKKELEKLYTHLLINTYTFPGKKEKGNVLYFQVNLAPGGSTNCTRSLREAMAESEVKLQLECFQLSQ